LPAAANLQKQKRRAGIFQRGDLQISG
jgi:hypothetical protein